MPVSAATGRNVPELLQVLRAQLPEGSPLYPADQLTDRDERFFAVYAERAFSLDVVLPALATARPLPVEISAAEVVLQKN